MKYKRVGNSSLKCVYLFSIKMSERNSTKINIVAIGKPILFIPTNMHFTKMADIVLVIYK